MAYFNEKEAHIFLEMMEGLPSQDIAAENGLTFEELMECKDIIIDKLNQDTVAYTTKEGFLPTIFSNSIISYTWNLNNNSLYNQL